MIKLTLQKVIEWTLVLFIFTIVAIFIMMFARL